MRRTALPILILAALTAACLVSTTEHTLYLDPDGGVEWVVLERDVRSTEDTPEKRDAEEAAFVEMLRAGEYPVAQGLAAFHPLTLDTDLLRETRPFTVRTRARFASIEPLLADFFDALGVEHDVRLERERGLVRLTVRLTVTGEEPESREQDVQEVASLLEDSWRIVLTRGAFVEARGFRPEAGDEEQPGDAVELRWDEVEKLADEGGIATLSLAWKTD